MQVWYRSRALYDTVMKLVKSNRFEEALQLAEEIPDVSMRSKALNEIVVEMAKKGKDYREALERAIQAALEVPGEDSTKSLMRLAFEFLEMGMLDQALGIAGHITDLPNRSKVQAEVALRLARQGKLDEAMKLINDILDEDVKTWAMSRLASEV
jgi:tetratricopeptide (TPR) repeat protein